MRTAYAVLGALFILVFAGAFLGALGKSDTKPIIKNSKEEIMTSLKLTSSVFEEGGAIPLKYTCDGGRTPGGVNPPLEIEGVPENAKSLVLIMDDPDAVKPAGIVWDHWIVWNIPVSTSQIQEGVEPAGAHGTGSGGGRSYSGPCPPDRKHTYVFKLYALDNTLNLPEGANKREVEKAMEGLILEQTKLTGTYYREGR